MRIYIDMDGVICDFKGLYTTMRNKVPTLKFPQSNREFWTNLKPIKGAIEAVNKLRGLHDVYILSAPSVRNPSSYSGKRIWIENYFDMDMVNKLILCNHKGLLSGDYLIDDNLKGKGQEDFKGIQIHFGKDPHPTWKEVLDTLVTPSIGCAYETHRLQKPDGQLYCFFCGANLSSIT